MSEWLPVWPALVVLVSAGSLAAQEPPTTEFRHWAAREVHRIGTSAADRDPGLAALADMAGPARILAFGEPFHLGKEALVQRNRLIRYLVTKRGFTAIALETALSSSKRVYDHVLWRTTEPDSVLVNSFTYGFGELPANKELIAWLRAYNAGQPPARRVGLYGIDLTGQLTGPARPGLEVVLDYVARVQPSLGDSVRVAFAGVLPLFDARRFPDLPRAEQDRIAGEIADLLALVQRNRAAFVRASSSDDYEWALRQAVAVEQENASLRLLPSGTMKQLEKGLDSVGASPRLKAMLAMREVAMADNLAWVANRERGRGRVFFFAHDTHLQAEPARVRPGDRGFELLDNQPVAGNYLRSRFGSDYFIVGTYYGTAEGVPAEPGFATLPPDPQGIDGLFGSLGLPAYVIDLRRLPAAGPLTEWFRRAHPTRGGNYGDTIGLVSPVHAFDAVVYLDRIRFIPP